MGVCIRPVLQLRVQEEPCLGVDRRPAEGDAKAAERLGHLVDLTHEKVPVARAWTITFIWCMHVHMRVARARGLVRAFVKDAYMLVRAYVLHVRNARMSVVHVTYVLLSRT